ncbi:hypothetical protein GCM10009741_53110 [Kribbella lupini]|uniref:Uncharacterized protein n=1 Tax=Kribbella lupini TaxID=291602 RepID=A0ABP4MFY9_9ACTN
MLCCLASAQTTCTFVTFTARAEALCAPTTVNNATAPTSALDLFSIRVPLSVPVTMQSPDR